MDDHSNWARIAAGLAICTLGGALCAWIGVPLPWMIGAMGAMAAAQMAGAGLQLPAAGRDAGFLVVGLTLGLYFSAPVVATVAMHWPWFIALGFAANALGTAAAFVLARLSGVNRATAYFGSMPGGASEMAALGERFGAAPDRVAFAHSMRMLLVVTLFPVGITLAGSHATGSFQPVAVPVDAAGLGALLAGGLAAGALARRLGAPTAFMLGPLALAIALTAGGVTLSAMPAVLVNGAQVLLGGVLGLRFDRQFLAAAPRFVAALGVSLAVTIALAVLVGGLLSLASDVPLAAALLAAAPGGIAEMAITARVLEVAPAYVTAAHVVRYVLVVLLTVPVYRLIARLRG